MITMLEETSVMGIVVGTVVGIGVVGKTETITDVEINGMEVVVEDVSCSLVDDCGKNVVVGTVVNGIDVGNAGVDCENGRCGRVRRLVVKVWAGEDSNGVDVGRVVNTDVSGRVDGDVERVVNTDVSGRVDGDGIGSVNGEVGLTTNGVEIVVGDSGATAGVLIMTVVVGVVYVE